MHARRASPRARMRAPSFLPGLAAIAALLTGQEVAGRPGDVCMSGRTDTRSLIPPRFCYSFSAHEGLRSPALALTSDVFSC